MPRARLSKILLFMRTSLFSRLLAALSASTLLWSMSASASTTYSFRVPIRGLAVSLSSGTGTTGSTSGSTSAPAVASVSPSSLSFSGEQGSTFAAQAITISNTGGGSFSVGTLSFQNGGQYFPVTNNCTSALTAGASCTLSVGFAPSAAGSYSDTLSIPANGQTYNVALSGTSLIPSGHVYAANYGNSTVSVCALDATTGAMTNCQATGSNISGPFHLYVSGTRAYVANMGGGSVTTCQVDEATGLFSNCQVALSGLNGPRGVQVYGNYTYVMNSGAGTILQCSADSTTGVLSGCVTVQSGLSTPTDITFFQGRVYIANTSANDVLSCAVPSGGGAFTGCVTSTSSVGGYPEGITFYGGNVIVVPEAGGPSPYLCNVDTSTGLFSNCQTTGSGLSSPSSLVVSNYFAYISNYGNSTIDVCNISSTGALSNCQNVNPGTLSNPIGMALGL